MIMSFCKNTLHSFLGIPHHHRDTLLPPPTTTAGLNSITKDDQKPPNIIESASVKPSSTTTTTTSSGGSGGSLHEITSCCSGSGGSSLLNSCTESLGLESSEQMEEEERVLPKSKVIVTPVKTTKKTRNREEPVKKFPPILSSLRRHDSVGECKTSFLKPVRENGRLILTEVTINRPEVFRASRQDGRLRLQFIKREEKSSEKLLPEYRETWPVKNDGGGGEGLWRCNEQNHHQHHHRRNRNQLLQMPLWNQQCVTSR